MADEETPKHPEDEVLEDAGEVTDAEPQLTEAEEQATRGSRPVKRKLTQAPVKREPEKKTEATAKQSSHGTKESGKRTGPGGFVKQSIDELRKVVWPSAAQTRAYFIAVLLFVLFIMAYVGLLDAAFVWATQKLFG